VAAPADLAADTTAERVAPGRYRLDVSRRWDFLLPSGGMVTSAALRAAAAELGDDDLRLVSATAIFCEPNHPGPVDIDVELLRAGGSAVQTLVHMRAPGGAGVRVTATFGRERVGPDLRGAAPPDVPPPDASLDLTADEPRNPHARARFFTNLECRMAVGTRFWTDEFVAGPARCGRWFRYRRPQRDVRGHLDRLALLPIADTMPAALTQAIGPGSYRFHAPSLDLTMHVVDDTDREWVLVSAYVRRARGGWAIGEAELWDDQGRLLAVASQAMYVRTMAGEPPVVDASTRKG